MDREASNVHLTKMCSVLLMRCLPKMPSSSLTSTDSQIATWRRSLTWTTSQVRLRSSTTIDGKDVCLTTGVSSPNPVQCNILPHRHSQLSDLIIRLYMTTSLTFRQYCDFITKCLNDPLTILILWMQITWPVILRSHWSLAYRYDDHKYVNIHRHQLFICSEINNGWSMTVTVL